MKKALVYAILSTICFSSTYIINRMISLGNTSWMWSASIRHFVMLAILFVYLLFTKRINYVIQVFKKHPFSWMLWSSVGFGLFYAPLTYGSYHGESWLTAGVWQLSIVAGALMTPLFYKTIKKEGKDIRVRNKVPKVALLFSCVILLGVIILQVQQAHKVSIASALQSGIPIAFAAIFYTLGNRKAMVLANDELHAIERVFIMCFASMPFWIVLSIVGLITSGLPSSTQILQVSIIAICSGCIATPMFFKATDLVKDDPKRLAVIESSVANEIVVTLAISVLLGVSQMPDMMEYLGLAIIIFGMFANSYYGIKEKAA